MEAEQLKALIERIETQNSHIAAETEVRKLIFDEAKGLGYCVKTMRRIIQLRQRQADERAEADAIEALYREALGL
jgi:uncharacterized protein (UPF0335 family)